MEVKEGACVGQRRHSSGGTGPVFGAATDLGSHQAMGGQLRKGLNWAAKPLVSGAHKINEAGHFLANRLRYGLSSVGNHGSGDFKVFCHDSESKRPISFWHDIPVFSTAAPATSASAPHMSAPLVNMITEIPKFTRAKMEINVKAEGTPIMQDEEDGQPRFYPSVMYWNYGAIPRTWEDTTPAAHGELKGLQGDDDPLDIIEIGSAPLESGSVTPVKCLGALCMIDGAEIDWKIIAVNPDDDIAHQCDDADALMEKYPHIVSGIREWLRWYKTPKGKPLAKFAFGEQLLDARQAMKVINENHSSYVKRFSTDNIAFDPNDLATYEGPPGPVND